MCTMIAKKTEINGSGKGAAGWFALDGVAVSFDHPFHAPFEHALNIDFLSESLGPSARVGVELSEAAARTLVQSILAVLDEAGNRGYLESTASAALSVQGGPQAGS